MKIYFLSVVSVIVSASILSQRMGIPGGYAFLFGVGSGILATLVGVILYGYLLNEKP